MVIPLGRMINYLKCWSLLENSGWRVIISTNILFCWLGKFQRLWRNCQIHSFIHLKFSLSRCPVQIQQKVFGFAWFLLDMCKALFLNGKWACSHMSLLWRSMFLYSGRCFTYVWVSDLDPNEVFDQSRIFN